MAHFYVPLSLFSSCRHNPQSNFFSLCLSINPHSPRSAKSLSLSLLQRSAVTTMARSFSLSLSRKLVAPTPSSHLLSFRAQSTNQPNNADLSDNETTSSDPLLRKLEDAIHRIIVRRSAPDWLPFLPGSSYWVPPPRSQNYGLAQLVEKLANPLTPEESLSTTTIRGWPSSDYFVKDANPHPMEAETTSNNMSQSEDEEG